MPGATFSPVWQRVSALRPRLRAGVSVQRQMYRGEAWYLLTDAANGRQQRLNRSAYELIGRLDGRNSVNHVWTVLLKNLGEHAPTQGEIVGILARLAESGLLQLADGSQNTQLPRVSAQRSGRRRAWVNPLAVPLPLFDPSGLLARLEPLAHRLLRPGALGVWAAVVTFGALAVNAEWQALRSHAAAHLTSAYYLTLAWICYPVIKGLHELAHALAVRRWGGEVHEVGVTLLFFTPAPYVDASAANGFRNRWQRAAVSAAGIMAELALAAAAAFAWLAFEPGTLRDLAFVTLFLCGASTLLFNANPLVRFDGYHLLCDLLELPNLAVRSQAFWMHLALRALGAADAASAPLITQGERKWLLLYAPVSAAYRIALALALTLWMGSKSAWLGWFAAALLFAFLVALPAWGMVRAIVAAVPEGRPRQRAGLAAAAASAATLALALGVPLPSTVVAQGVVWPPEHALIRAESAGFVEQVLAQEGQAVEPGTPLVLLADPALRAEHESLLWRVRSLQAEQHRMLLTDPAQAKNAVEELGRVRAELERAEERIGHLTVRSKAAGRLVLPRSGDLPGAFVAKGATLGYVLSQMPTAVRAVVPNENAPLVRAGARDVEVFLAGGNAPIAARLARELPAAAQALPSPALGELGGGRHLTDPADQQGVRTLEPVFLFDVVLQGEAAQSLGQRAWVRFSFDAEPLGVQCYRRLRQLLLKHFNPVA